MTVFRLTKMCAPTFVVWSGASGRELIPVGESPSFPLIRGGLSLWHKIEIRDKPRMPFGEKGLALGNFGLSPRTLLFLVHSSEPSENPTAGWLPGSRYSW